MAADARGVVSLQDLCLITVSSYLTPSKVWSIHRLVPYVHCKRIEHIVHSFICDNFMAISHTDQFLALDEKEIHWLLDNQDIKVSEAAMLDSLARWYKHNERERENALKNLLEKVHMSVIEGTVLSELIKKYQLVKVIPELRKYKKVLPQRVNVDDLIRQENMCNVSLTCMSQKRLSSHDEVPYFISMFNNLRSHLHVEQIKYWMPFMSKDIDIELKKLGKDIFNSYFITCGNKMYIFGSVMEYKEGGERSMQKISVCFDMLTKQFTDCSDPPENLPLGGLHVICGVYLFIIGGNKTVDRSNTELQTVYRYDTVKDEWQTMPSTIFGHTQPHIFGDGPVIEIAFSFKGRYVFVFGKFCERFDMCTNTWMVIYFPLTWFWGVLYSCGFIAGEHIYLFGSPGASHGVLCCLAYSMRTGYWKEPFMSNLSFDFTKHYFGKVLGISKVVLRNANYRGRIKYKISELNIAEGWKQRKLLPGNEKSFLCTPGFIAFDVSIITRGVCAEIKESNDNKE